MTMQESLKQKLLAEIEQRKFERENSPSEATLSHNRSLTHQTMMNKGRESHRMVEDLINDRRINGIRQYAEGKGIWKPSPVKKPTKEDFLNLMKKINTQIDESPAKKKIRNPPVKKEESVKNVLGNFWGGMNLSKSRPRASEFDASGRSSKMRGNSGTILRQPTSVLESKVKAEHRSRASTMSISFNLNVDNAGGRDVRQDSLNSRVSGHGDTDQ